MAKRLYICEVCGHRNSKEQVVCCKCVERDLIAINDRLKRLEEKLK